MIHIFRSVDSVNSHFFALKITQGRKHPSQTSGLTAPLVTVSGVWRWPAVSSIYSRYTAPGGKGGEERGGNLEICHPKWAQPTWLAIQTVFTTLPKAQTLPIDITSSCKWCQQSLATSQQKNVDASVRDLNVFPGSVWWDSPRSCLVVMRWNWDVECHYTSTVQYSTEEVSHCTQNCIPIFKLFNSNSYTP